MTTSRSVRQGVDATVMVDALTSRRWIEESLMEGSLIEDPLTGDQRPAYRHSPEFPVSPPPAPGSSPGRVVKAATKRILKLPYRLLMRLTRPFQWRFANYLSAMMAEHLNAAVRTALDQNNRLLQEMSTTLRELEALQVRLESGRFARFQARLELLERSSATLLRRVAVACGPDRVLVRSQSGFLLCPSDDPALIAFLVDSGDLEQGTRLLIQRFLRPGDGFVDAGANVGLHTLAAAHALQGHGVIHAFEAYSPTADLLRTTVQLNDLESLVVVHALALSDREGVHAFHLGRCSGHHSLHTLSPGEEKTGGVEVPTRRLDDCLPQGTRLDLLKIDVEGAELEVIAGASRLLAELPNLALIVEYGPSHLQRVGLNPDQWFEAFASHGFTYRVIHPLTGELEVASREYLEESVSLNLFMARSGSSAWARLA
jgi:FkbM family methyltransferase